MASENCSIFDIQSFSVHDGPGSRTTIFFKGCPLKCEWCANPESWNKSIDVMWRKSKCTLCGKCIDACNSSAIQIISGLVSRDTQKCIACSNKECVSACANRALEKIGSTYTTEAIMRTLNSHRDSWGPEGGVTFSGGEPLFQSKQLIVLLKNCADEYIHTAIETTAFCKKDTFLEVFNYIDFAFIDIKHMDSKKHLEKTGIDNRLILSNIEALSKSDWSGRLIIRVPVIHGFNDTKENILSLCEFMLNLGLTEVNLLPFHSMGESKWTGLSKEYEFSGVKSTSQENLELLKTLISDKGLHCYIGSNTPF